MNVLDTVSVFDILDTLQLGLQKESPHYLPIPKLIELCLSHETLRALVKDLLAELMLDNVEKNKDVIQRAQAVLGGPAAKVD